MAARTHPRQENETAGERRRLGGVDDVHQALVCHRADLARRLEEAATANSAGDVHGEEDRATGAERRRPEQAGVGDIARADLNGGRKQITRLRRITPDTEDRRPASRELAGDLQPGSTGAADNAVRRRHAVTAVFSRVWPASCLPARSLRPRIVPRASASVAAASAAAQGAAPAEFFHCHFVRCHLRDTQEVRCYRGDGQTLCREYQPRLAQIHYDASRRAPNRIVNYKQESSRITGEVTSLLHLEWRVNGVRALRRARN